MKIKLTALALAGLVAAAPAALAQSNSCSKSTSATLAVAGDSACSAKAKKEVAAEPIPLRTQLASLVESGRIAGLVVDGKTYSGCDSTCVAEKLVRESLAAKISAHCEASAQCSETLAKNVDKTLAGGVCAGKELASLAKTGRIEGVVIGEQTLTGEAAVVALTKIAACPEFQAECRDRMQAELAAATKQCSKSSAKLAGAGDGSNCSKQAGELASNKGDCAKSAPSKSGTLASASDGSSCSKTAAELAAKKEDCAKACAKSGATLASAGGGDQCDGDKSAAASGVVSACAQLAALIQPERIAGVVVEGKAYLGEKAFGVVCKLVEQDLAAKISVNCEESRKCEKTLASNVEKTLAGGLCMKSELTALLAAGRIDSLIVDGESACGESAAASLAKITACPEFQAECRERAGLAASKATSCAPIGVDVQVAALIDPARVSAVVVDGKSYRGAEAATLVASLVRESLCASIKEKCEASRACEKTLATNVDKAYAGGTCAGGQLASLVESGRIQCVTVGGQELAGSEAKAAIVEIVSCAKFQATCAELASAKAAKTDCSKPCDANQVQ